jgi:hypothetical protein
MGNCGSGWRLLGVDMEEWLESGPGADRVQLALVRVRPGGDAVLARHPRDGQARGRWVRSNSDRVAEVLLELGDLLAARCNAAVRAGVRERVVWIGDRCLVPHDR